MAAQSFGAVAGDPRVGPLLQGVHRQYVGDQDFANNNGHQPEIIMRMIDRLKEDKDDSLDYYQKNYLELSPTLQFLDAFNVKR